VRQDGGRVAHFTVRNRCNLPRRAHQLASARENSTRCAGTSPVALDLHAVVGRVRVPVVPVALPRRRMIRNERRRLRLSSSSRAKSRLMWPLSLTLPHKGMGPVKTTIAID
jgi:hypothetical protein